MQLFGEFPRFVRYIMVKLPNHKKGVNHKNIMSINFIFYKWLDEGKKLTMISALPAAEDKEFGLLPAAVNGAMPKTEKELTPADNDNLLKAAGNDKEQTVVIYCGFVACRRSHIGAKILVENGFKNVYRYPAGITGWSESGFPLTK